MDQEELEWLNEDFKAAERIGATPEACMRWVLKFAQTDLEKCSEGQWGDLCTEVHVFTSRGPLLRIGRGLTHLGAAFDWGGAPPEETFPKKKRVTVTFRPSREQVTALQKQTQSILDAFAQGQELKFELGPLHIYLEAWRAFQQGGLSFRTHTPFDAFGFQLALLFSHYHGRVRRCRECTAMFLAERRNQRYCATRCLSRVTQRRWRERHLKTQSTKAAARTKRRGGTKGGTRHGEKRRS